MKKKGMNAEVVIVLILAIIIIVAIFGIYTSFSNITKSTANKESVKAWVRTTALKEKIPLTSSLARPPVPYLEEPLELDKSDLLFNEGAYPKGYKEIADSMYDCWDAFDRGETDFLSKGYINNIGQSSFCFPCRAIKFSENIKKDDLKIKGFNNFLNSEKPIFGENNPTYVQYLLNNKEYKMTEEELKNDIIDTNKDLYIMFIGLSGVTWRKIITGIDTDDTNKKIGMSYETILGRVDKGKIDLGIAVMFGVPGLIFARNLPEYVNIIQGNFEDLTIAQIFVGDTFKSKVIIADSEKILSICNQEDLSNRIESSAVEDINTKLPNPDINTKLPDPIDVIT